MPRYLPRLNAIRAFEAAGRHQSFSAAAEELNVSHAAISRHVRGLEQDLGIQLFKIVARGVALTEEGRRYLAAVTPALDALSEASETIRSTEEGSLSISSEPTFASKWLMPNLGAFKRAHPQIDVRLVSSPELADIRNREFDLALRYCNELPAGLEADLISASPMYPFAAPDFPDIACPSELLRHPLLHEDHGQLWKRWFAKAGIADPGLPRKPQRYGWLLAIEGALAGQGVVLIPQELAQADMDAGRLKRLSPLGLALGSYRLVYRKDAGRRKAVAAFRDWIIERTAIHRERPEDEAPTDP